MNTNSNIRVNIIGEFQKKGFNDAQKATTGLEKSFKRMAGALAAAFSVRAVTQFAKASLKAFKEDEKAALRLSQTVKNLGLGFADPSIKNYIASLERSANISDDVLRPAMEKLLRTTQSVTQSQQLLNLALDISRGTGTDLVTVASDLSRAYVGQTRGLAKYNIGLTQAELKTKSFSELQEILLKQFSGQSAAYLETYAGKVEALTIAYGNAQEVIGEGLADAFLRLSGDGGIKSATNAMADFANEISNVITGISVMLEKLNAVTTWGGWKLFKISNIPVAGAWLEFFSEAGKKEKANQVIANPTQRVSPRAVEAASAAADKAAAKRQRELIALQKKAEREAARRAAAAAKREREQQALRRAGTVFDMENIQIVAAMQGKIDGEQRLRLTALLAINTKNAEAAEKLSSAVLAANAPALANLGIMVKAGDTIDDVIKKIINSQANLALLGMGITDIPKAKNPFEDWTSIIAAILADIGKVTAAINNIPKYNPTGANVVNPNTVTSVTPNAVVSTPAQIIAAVKESLPPAYAGTSLATDPNILATARLTAQLDSIMTQNALTNQLASDRYTAMLESIQLANQVTNDLSAARYAAMQEYYVTVNVAGNVTTQTDLVKAVQDGLYQSQKTGTSVLYSSTAI